MDLLTNKLYNEDIEYVANIDLPWKKLNGKTVMLSGATGMIGSFIIDVLMRKNEKDLNCTIIALGRNKERIERRFEKYCQNKLFKCIEYDVNNILDYDAGKVDYILHLASNTHPLQYSTDPIGTITTNIIGLKNLLDYAAEHNNTRFVFASSNEIYGQNRGDAEKFDELYCGYIDSNTLRAGYPESKRCGEALCQAYIAQKGLDIVIPRVTRSYGATLLESDTKALSQFIHKALDGEDIILKSEGKQFFSYMYVADTVSGVLTVLLKGENGEAYNIADEESDITLKDLAALIAKIVEKKVVFELPDKVESAGYSTATKARLDSTKLKRLGWGARYDINQGIKRTIEMLRDTLER